MRSAIVASSLGNIIEWYDFGLYSAFAAVFTKLFFPLDNPKIAMIKVFGIFALGFVCRPLGALIFGHFGDKVGRAKTLRATILLISIPTLLTAFIPSYQQIGIFAPTLLILFRLIQGISLGGEYSGNIAYLVEIAPKNHRAFIASFAPLAANIGILLSSLVVLLMQLFSSERYFTLYGWRLAFIIGVLLSWGVLYLRKSFTETAVFKELQQQHRVLSDPVTTLFKTIPFIMLRAIGLVALGAVFYYLCFVYLEVYLMQYGGLSHNLALTIISSCVAAMLILVPIGGLICDKIGRRYSYFIVAGGIAIYSIVGFKLLLTHHIINIIIAMSIFTLLSSLEQATTSVTVVEQFPANIRYSGVSISYNITQALLGGTSPVIAALLITLSKNTLAPAFYLAIIALITLMTAFFSLKRSSEPSNFNIGPQQTQEK